MGSTVPSPARWPIVALFLLSACAPSGEAPSPEPTAVPRALGTVRATLAPAPNRTIGPPALPPPAAVAETAVITTAHRAIPGAMFGGWGPHLGHLVRTAEDRLFFADDACEPGSCDVDVNQRLDVHELVGDAWVLRGSVPLPAGIQQNTGTIADGDQLLSFGVDVLAHQIVSCRIDPDDAVAATCAPIVASALPLSTNYVGAAVSPDGYPVTWATTVGNGSGGSFHWFVDYGGGWNGPRTGHVGGYDDASYVNIAFDGGARSTSFVMHAQLVAGVAPNWAFDAAFADGDAASGDAVAFALLPDAPDDPLASTNDVFVDPASGDTHILARTAGGAAAVLFRPRGGSFGPPSFALSATYRARWVLLADGTLVAAYGRDGQGLYYRAFPAQARVAGQPLDVAAAPEIAVPLPAGYETLWAIYPESRSYQGSAPPSLNLALVGAARDTEVLWVTADVIPAPL